MQRTMGDAIVICCNCDAPRTVMPERCSLCGHDFCDVCEICHTGRRGDKAAGKLRRYLNSSTRSPTSQPRPTQPYEESAAERQIIRPTALADESLNAASTTTKPTLSDSETDRDSSSRRKSTHKASRYLPLSVFSPLLATDKLRPEDSIEERSRVENNAYITPTPPYRGPADKTTRQNEKIQQIAYDTRSKEAMTSAHSDTRSSNEESRDVDTSARPYQPSILAQLQAASDSFAKAHSDSLATKESRDVQTKND